MIHTPREVDELEDRISELESDLEDSKSRFWLTEDELAESLHEIDRLTERVEKLEAECRDWEGVAECARERAEQAGHSKHLAFLREFFQIREDFSDASAVQEVINQFCELQSMYEWQADELKQWIDSSQDDEENFYLLMSDRDAVQERANSWFEIAKELLRTQDIWVTLAEQHEERADKAEVLLDEFKAALRTLSR